MCVYSALKNGVDNSLSNLASYFSLKKSFSPLKPTTSYVENIHFNARVVKSLCKTEVNSLACFERNSQHSDTLE